MTVHVPVCPEAAPEKNHESPRTIMKKKAFFDLVKVGLIWVGFRKKVRRGLLAGVSKYLADQYTIDYGINGRLLPRVKFPHETGAGCHKGK
jgi:hypothetical protein